MKLKESLEQSLSSELLGALVGGYDLIGDMAITIIPQELEEYEQLIGEAILTQNKRIKVVAKRAANHTGKYRTLPLTVIAGEQRKETICREYGCRLIVNPEQAYFSIRSGRERKRIADQVKDQEQILVMFSGIAPYPIMFARHTNAKHITGIELNPAAHLLGLKNVELNKIKNISLFQGDIAEKIHLLTTHFDRIIMPLPHKAVSFLPQALSVLKSGGMIHLYAFQDKTEKISCLPEISATCRSLGRELVDASLFFCGHPSPSKYRVCIDASIA